MDSPLEVYIVPIILTVLTLITLALVLSVRSKPKHVSKEVEALLKDQQESSEPAGTVYLSDGEGHVVRRSTRARKPATPTPGYVPSATPRTTRKTAQAEPEAAKTPAATPRRSTRAVAAKVVEPEVVSEEEVAVAPRSRRTPRA
ncbi:hypothetical protein HYH02_011929 [Chlamydomonas schloesseri]|uniref:Uncharacterized protein n=1 Tax=Chlamydomonas schloesseri TaxID=2026947 RepID=A0A835SYB2_9CHLO|nr:hypothetical protein HYH02_011929 [Chlamydomonas schloesseri]|eukprot:KAG2435429.1 hypothetical protein HYH02_011929 [Chlamydomonas schloesseri]